MPLLRRQVGRAHPELQRLSAAGGFQRAGHRFELRWLRGQLLHAALDGLVARFQKAGGLSHASRLRPRGALHRIVARRPDAAETQHHGLPQARRRARHRLPGALRHRDQAGDRDRPGAVPQCVRHDDAGVVEGQPRLHLRIQPARPPGVPRDRSGRADRQDARADRRTEQDFHLLQPDWARAFPAAAATATIWTTARRSSGRRSATAGSTCTSTTASPAR